MAAKELRRNYFGMKEESEMFIHRLFQKGKDKEEEEWKKKEGGRGRIVMRSCNSRKMVINL
jgi:hypothetical protein